MIKSAKTLAALLCALSLAVTVSVTAFAVETSQTEQIRAALAKPLAMVGVDAGQVAQSSLEELSVSGDYIYSLNENQTANIVYYTGSDAEVFVPQKLDDYFVESVSGVELRDLSGEVNPRFNVFPFIGNTAIRSITFPNEVKSVGWYAMNSCLNLSDITLSSNLDFIDSASFINTAWLNEQPDGIASIGNVAVIFKGDAPGQIEFPVGTRTIAAEFFSPDFSNSKSLKSVVIPKSVMSIGLNALGYYYETETEGDYELYRVEKCEGFTIYGYKDTAAQAYALENGFAFVELEDESEPLLGDVDLDGKVTISDVTEIQRYLSGFITLTAEQKKVADVNRDGDVTINDATDIQKYLAGIIKEF